MKKIFSAILILFLVYWMYFVFIIPSESNEISIMVSVDDIMGFNLTDTALVFGTIPPGGVGGKNITINNNAKIPQFVHITSTGVAGDWIMVSNNNFFILPNDQKIITSKLFVPMDAKHGEYTGILNIQFKKII